MSSFLKGDIVLLPYPFSDLTMQKVRPAVVASADAGKYDDIFVVPLTSRVHDLSVNEFLLENWKEAGLNVPTAIKRGCVLINSGLVIKKVGTLNNQDLKLIDTALKIWFGL